MAVVPHKGKWQVRVRDNAGEFFPYKSFEKKIEAKDYERELLERAKRGVQAGVVKSAQEMTFAEYWQKWCEDCREDTSLGWQISQNQMMRDHIMPHLGKLTMAEIDKPHIRSVLKEGKKKGLGQQMLIHLFSLMHQIFFAAIEEHEILYANPVRLNMKPEKPTVVRDFMKPAEAVRFLMHVKDDAVAGVAIWIMVLCGLRIGEVQGLQWKNVDLESGILFIARQWNRKERRFKFPKNGEPARIPMPPDLVEYLKGKKPDDVFPNDLVVCNQKRELVHYDTLYDALKRLCLSGGFISLTPHELRHTCSELWIENGATKEDLRRLFNQKSDTAIEAYIHRTHERLERLSGAVRLQTAAPKLQVLK